MSSPVYISSPLHNLNQHMIKFYSTHIEYRFHEARKKADKLIEWSTTHPGDAIFHIHTRVDGDQGQNVCREVSAARKNQEVKKRLLGSWKEANSMFCQ